MAINAVRRAKRKSELKEGLSDLVQHKCREACSCFNYRTLATIAEILICYLQSRVSEADSCDTASCKHIALVGGSSYCFGKGREFLDDMSAVSWRKAIAVMTFTLQP